MATSEIACACNCLYFMICNDCLVGIDNEDPNHIVSQVKSITVLDKLEQNERGIQDFISRIDVRRPRAYLWLAGSHHSLANSVFIADQDLCFTLTMRVV